MTIELHDAVNGDGLFDIWGKAFHAIATINTARLTTVPTELQDVLAQHNKKTVDADLERIAAVLNPLPDGFRSVGDGTIQALVNYAQNLLIELVEDDNPQPDRQLVTTLEELIRQMEAASASVDASAITAAVAADGDNAGDGVIVLSTKRGDGLVQEHALAETIEVEATSSGLTASLSFLGEESVPLLSALWPRGSGANNSISAVDAAASLLLNGDMEDEDDVANAPDDWIVSVGTIGTTLKMTDVEVQTVAISGTPTGGHYLLHWTDPDGKSYTTAPLAHNATASTVQTELRKFPGLGSITVSSTGTSPNLTHTITFTGKGGNLNQLTSTNNLTGGTPAIAHATTTEGSGNVFAGGKALELDSDGSQLTTLNQRLTTLSPSTAYGFSGWFLADVVPAAGQITIDLVDGIGGTVIQDDQGVRNSFTFAAADLTTSFKHVDDLVAARNEVQRVTITGSPTGGTFTLTYDGQTTAGIAFDATAAAVQSALEALSNIAAGDVSCSGGPLPGTPVDVTFTGQLGSRNVVEMTADGSGLTGGTSPTANVSTTTEGSPGEVVFRTPRVLPAAIYLRVRISTAVSAGTSVFVDHLALTAMQALYAGGPLAAVFAGSDEFKAGDLWTVTVTNDRAGLLQEWTNRIVDMAALGLLLPSNSAGAETVPDSVVG